MQQSDKRHWSLEPLQRRRITPNSVKMTRKCAYWTKHRERLHDPYTGNKTNDHDFHQPYWKSSQIELCQTPTNKIQHDPMTVSCNKQISKIIFFPWKSQAIPLKNISTSNLERNVTRDTRSWKWTHNPGSERQSAHWTTSASSFIPAARSGESPTSSKVSAEDMK